MHVSEETPVSLRVSWTPPNAHVLRYRVSYAKLGEGERREQTVSRPLDPPAWNPVVSALLVSAGAGSGRRESGDPDVAAARHALQHPGHRRVPQQGGRRRLGPGQNQ